MNNKEIGLIVKKLKKLLGKGKHVLHEPYFIGNEIKYISNTIKSNFVSTSEHGKYVQLFEKKIANFIKSKFAISVINGTQAIFIALKATGVNHNDEVLVPSLTFVGTVNAINYLGARPHFVDSNIKNFAIDCDKLEKYLEKISLIKKNQTINKTTGKVIKAIIPVHIFGHPCDMDKIKKIAKKFKLIIVEDAAEALGSYYKKKHLGTFGDVGCFSFNGNKIITTGGGGMVVLNNRRLAKTLRHLVTTAKINHKWEYIHDKVGYNFRMPNLNAALGLAQFEKIKFFLKKKRNIFNKYSKCFEKINGIKIFKEPKFAKSNYWLQTLILDKKNEKFKNKLLKEFHQNNIFSRPAWKLISELKPYKKCQKMDLSGSKEIYRRVINLPSSSNLNLKR